MTNNKEKEDSLEESDSSTTSRSQLQAELTFEGCKIVVQILLYPADLSGDRDILLSVSNEGDFPLAQQLKLSELETNLPPQLILLLRELKDSMPNRNARRLLSDSAKAKSKNAGTSKPTKTPERKIDTDQPVQLSIF